MIGLVGLVHVGTLSWKHLGWTYLCYLVLGTISPYLTTATTQRTQTMTEPCTQQRPAAHRAWDFVTWMTCMTWIPGITSWVIKILETFGNQSNRLTMFNQNYRTSWKVRRGLSRRILGRISFRLDYFRTHEITRHMSHELPHVDLQWLVTVSESWCFFICSWDIHGISWNHVPRIGCPACCWVVPRSGQRRLPHQGALVKPWWNLFKLRFSTWNQTWNHSIQVNPILQFSKGNAFEHVVYLKYL